MTLEDAIEGSIPACAGEPAPRQLDRRTPQVHPRVCGGARGLTITARLYEGPSPRVRGSLTLHGSTGCPSRSIPACAGEPCSWLVFSSASRVHPRVCGGAQVEATFFLSF